MACPWYKAKTNSSAVTIPHSLCPLQTNCTKSCWLTNLSSVGGHSTKTVRSATPVFEIDGHEYYIPFELELGQSLQFIQEAVQNNEYEKLTPDDCIKAYAKGLVYGRANVVMALNPPEDCHEFKNLPMFYEASGPVYYKPPMNSSIYASLRYETTLNANRGNNDWFSWICSLTLYEADRLRLPKCSDGAWKNQMSPAIWTLGTARVKYCLSRKPKNPCQLNVALNLIYVTVCFNALKFVIIVILATSNLANREPLVTIRDAVASFIDSQEPATKGMCLLSSAEVHYSQKLDDYQGYQPSYINHRTADARWPLTFAAGCWLRYCMIFSFDINNSTNRLTVSLWLWLHSLGF